MDRKTDGWKEGKEEGREEGREAGKEVGRLSEHRELLGESTQK